MKNFKFTEQINKTIEAWLKFKGYDDIFDYANDVHEPLYEGVGYSEEWLGETIILSELTNFTITKASFLNFYYNTGDDGSQHQMRVDLGYEIINSILEGGEVSIPTPEGLIETCEYFRMSDCEEVSQGHPLEDYESNDLGWEISVKLI